MADDNEAGSARATDAQALVATRPSSRSDALLADALVPEFVSLSGGSSQTQSHSMDMQRRFEELRRQLDEQGQSHASLMASGAVLSGGLSVGYVVWLIRGGVLASTMLSALPAWRLIDPLPVLNEAGRSAGASANDDDAIDRLFGEAPDEPTDDAPSNDNASPAQAAAPDPRKEELT